MSETKKRRGETSSRLIPIAEQSDTPPALHGIAENLYELQQDLQIARKIQTRLLPPSPKLPGYDFGTFYQPAGEVGGDFYDFIPMEGGKIGMLVADASGKGLAGALLMVQARAAIRTMASITTSPRDILSGVNRVLNKDLEKGRFVSAFFALLDPKQSQLTVANAGHTPMLLCREVGKAIVSIAPKGLILGVMPDEKFHPGITEEIVPLYPGDRFLLYSDGVSELMNPVTEEFGMERLETWMRVNSHLWSEDALKTLIDALEVHRAGQMQSDDITILTGRVDT
jgi:sigma-B regulation protein RsbU (phosphoserine phosphatase)